MLSKGRAWLGIGAAWNHWEKAHEVLAKLRELAALGVTHVQTSDLDCSRTDWLEMYAEKVISQAAQI